MNNQEKEIVIFEYQKYSLDYYRKPNIHTLARAIAIKKLALKLGLTEKELNEEVWEVKNY